MGHWWMAVNTLRGMDNNRHRKADILRLYCWDGMDQYGEETALERMEGREGEQTERERGERMEREGERREREKERREEIEGGREIERKGGRQNWADLAKG